MIIDSKIAILSDSLDAINNTEKSYYANDIKREPYYDTLKKTYIKFKICWIPSHKNTRENELVVKAIKNAITGPLAITVEFITEQDFIPSIEMARIPEPVVQVQNCTKLSKTRHPAYCPIERI